MSTTVLVLTRGSVFDVCAIIDFYLRVLCAPLPLSRLAVATVVSTVISSSIPIHSGTLYFKPIYGHHPRGHLVRIGMRPDYRLY